MSAVGNISNPNGKPMFVMRNGWTTPGTSHPATAQKASAKVRPQSSNHLTYKRRTLAVNGNTNSNFTAKRREWRYAQQGAPTPTMNSLNAIVG